MENIMDYVEEEIYVGYNSINKFKFKDMKDLEGIVGRYYLSLQFLKHWKLAMPNTNVNEKNLLQTESNAFSFIGNENIIKSIIASWGKYLREKIEEECLEDKINSHLLLIHNFKHKCPIMESYEVIKDGTDRMDKIELTKEKLDEYKKDQSLKNDMKENRILNDIQKGVVEFPIKIKNGQRVYKITAMKDLLTLKLNDLIGCILFNKEDIPLHNLIESFISRESFRQMNAKIFILRDCVKIVCMGINITDTKYGKLLMVYNDELAEPYELTKEEEKVEEKEEEKEDEITDENTEEILDSNEKKDEDNTGNKPTVNEGSESIDPFDIQSESGESEESK